MGKLSTSTSNFVEAEKVDRMHPDYKKKTHPTLAERAAVLAPIQGYESRVRSRVLSYQLP